MAKRIAQAFNSGYASTITNGDSKQRYADKLKLINGCDPYELPREEWPGVCELARNFAVFG